jgi:hypothetical protein
MARMEVEFRIGKTTLVRRIEDCGLEPGPDGCFSGYQIRQLLESNRDVIASRRDKMEAEASLARARVAVIEKVYLRRDKLAIALANTYQYMRKVIERSGLAEASRVALLRALGAGPEALLEGIGESLVENDGAPGRGKRGRRNPSSPSNGKRSRHHYAGATL